MLMNHFLWGTEQAEKFLELTLCSITYLSLYEQVIRDPFFQFFAVGSKTSIYF